MQVVFSGFIYARHELKKMIDFYSNPETVTEVFNTFNQDPGNVERLVRAIPYDLDSDNVKFCMISPVDHNQDDLNTLLKIFILDHFRIPFLSNKDNIEIKLNSLKAELCFALLKSFAALGSGDMTDEEIESFICGGGLDYYELEARYADWGDELDDETEAELSGIFEDPLPDAGESGSPQEGSDNSTTRFGGNGKYEYLVGLENFKRELGALTKFGVRQRILKSRDAQVFPYHYTFAIEPGMGVTTIIKLFSQQLYNLDIVENSEFIEYEGSLDFDSGNDSAMSAIFSKGHDGNYYVASDYGVIAIDIINYLSDPKFRFDRLLDIMWEARGKVVFVLLLNSANRETKEKVLDKIESRINTRHIEFVPYTNEQYLEISARILKKMGLQLDDAARDKLLELITRAKNDGKFENLHTIQKLLEEIKVQKLFQPGEDENIVMVGGRDIAAIMDKGGPVSKCSAWDELDRIIGLAQVKDRLHEIAANAQVYYRRREAGLETEPFSYHMAFLGNPGTGKTTVARILGRILKEAGILSKGEVFEVARDSLVGQYVGQTAPLVRDRVTEALGSVLFIDEAYSLYTGDGGQDRRDYGHEAVSTLLKEMENKRDQLVVVIAGYPEPMEDLLKMNPGLQERFPHKIEFPDYSSEELIQIFHKCMGDGYQISEEGLEEVRQLFTSAVANADKDFANGRLARNIAERIKMKQAQRLCEAASFSREDLTAIKLGDVESIFEDDDIKKIVEKGQVKDTIIGFKAPLQ